MAKNIEKNRKKAPKEEAEKKISPEQLLDAEMQRHIVETGRLNENDKKKLLKISDEFGPEKALAVMDQIVLDRILADRSKKLQEFKDQRSNDVGFA